ncbi:hypothetical protein PR202_gb18513 [Eleusine coracana subsp. coracana]|uniref:Yippee domain-containing protein n=1 Tax=Eleusine coracana subsp. coracana TaxID=191504 RepID=A0AAV5F3G6_ELECO|nr:hypothetical protein PR202_gb18513 [Eleusine coracana subsp. coracana]
MASSAPAYYRCAECGADLNLSAAHLYPADLYFEAGNKGTLSFSWVDESRLRFAPEDRIRPFFETLNYWGIQRKRIRISCDASSATSTTTARRSCRAPASSGWGPARSSRAGPGTGSRPRSSPSATRRLPPPQPRDEKVETAVTALRFCDSFRAAFYVIIL